MREKSSLCLPVQIFIFLSTFYSPTCFWYLRKLACMVFSAMNYAFSSVLFSQYVNFIPPIDQSEHWKSEWMRALPVTEQEGTQTRSHASSNLKPMPLLIHCTSSWVATTHFPHYFFTHTDAQLRIIQPWQNDVSLPKAKRIGHINYSSQLCLELTTSS